MELAELLRLKRTVRVIGFDDAPFVRRSGLPVSVAGVVCAGTRFEGMLWGTIEADGWDATDRLSELLGRSKFLPQIHLILLDGISMGGFNMINLPQLSDRLQRPCVAVMRRLPNLTAIRAALQNLPEFDRRWSILQQAGDIHAMPPFFFQVCGADPAVTARLLANLTDRGHVPEALRLAHLITAAVVKGESGRQA